MENVINLLKELGAVGLDVFWLPVAIWTLLAVTIAGLLKVYEDAIPPAYHYHSRVALLWSLAAGAAGSALLYYLPFVSGTEAGVSAKFIVIQNPVTVTAAAPESSVGWTDPALWSGFFLAAVILAALAGLLKLTVSFTRLQLFSKKLGPSEIESKLELSEANRRRLRLLSKISIHFSDAVAVPCTFGWRRKRIVLPQELRQHPEKLNLALRHELVHIANSDYLINTTVQTVKAFFFFHPLVHRLATQIEEYREMHCDRHVLQDTEISQKNYAELLLELSPKTVFKSQPAAVNMAVHPSTLKKRIRTMMTSNRPIPSMKWSLSLMLAFTLLLGGLMACSDIEEGGITQAEVEQSQSEMNKFSEENDPLYILNGEQMDSPENKERMARLKPKYIESVNVWKGEDALDKYGQKGKNGVVHIKLIDKEKAMSDLRSEEEMKALKSGGDNYNSPKKEIFITVEKQPEIIGGQKALYENLIYPKECKEAEVQGRVILQFVVTKEGSVRDAEVVRGIGSGCDQAALNAVNTLQFKPGKQQGKAVNVRFSLPILFQLKYGDERDKSTSSNLKSLDHKKLKPFLTGNIFDEFVINAYPIITKN